MPTPCLSPTPTCTLRRVPPHTTTLFPLLTPSMHSQEVIGMFTSRDLLGELARYPNKADGMKTKAHEFMIPLGRMIYCSPKDSLYQCLLVMSELKVTANSGVARSSPARPLRACVPS